MYVCVLLVVVYAAGVHDDDDPEYSILKSRMVAKMKEEGLQVRQLTMIIDLVQTYLGRSYGCSATASLHAL